LIIRSVYSVCFRGIDLRVHVPHLYFGATAVFTGATSGMVVGVVWQEPRKSVRIPTILVNVFFIMLLF